MRRATIRRDPATKTWTVRRPAYGFSPNDDEIRTGFTTRRAAHRWLDRTMHPDGTATAQLELCPDQYYDAT